MDIEDGFLGFIIGVIIAIPLFLIISKPPPEPQVQFSTPQNQATYYENNEEWEIIKDPETGRTQGVRVKRTAKEA